MIYQSLSIFMIVWCIWSL